MAKRSSEVESTYSPLDLSLARSVIQGSPAPTDFRAPGSIEALQDEVRPFSHDTVAPNSSEGLPRQQRFASREKRVLLTSDEERRIERLVDRVAESLNTSLTLSHVLRACMEVLCHAERELQLHAQKMAPLRRPAHGNRLATAQFEQMLAKLVSRALQDAPPIR